MKFGIGFANTGPFAGGPGAAMLGQAAEAAGFDSVWTVEHVVYPEGYESTYPYAPDGKMPGSATTRSPIRWFGWPSSPPPRPNSASRPVSPCFPNAIP